MAQQLQIYIQKTSEEDSPIYLKVDNWEMTFTRESSPSGLPRIQSKNDPQNEPNTILIDIGKQTQVINLMGTCSDDELPKIRNMALNWYRHSNDKKGMEVMTLNLTSTQQYQGLVGTVSLDKNDSFSESHWNWTFPFYVKQRI
mgnify:FL=1|jgi:hypothetical protein